MTGLLDSAGREVSLGAEVGRGGEGTVYEVAGNPAAVAKVYKPEIRHQRQAKIEAMVGLRRDALDTFVAWPERALFDQARQFAGFIMERVPVAYRPVHELSGPSSRIQNFPGRDWRFLLRVAENLCVAVDEVHRAGHVIGDLNHTNILVNGGALVRLIDADSFQITAENAVHRCGVGIAEFTPPELQGADLSVVVRTADHDRFSLAVLVFQLLFLGRHPFAGRPVNRNDIPLPEAIRTGLYVYSSRRNSSIEPPPNTVHPKEIGDAVVSLFEDAFSPGTVERRGRPDAARWGEALRQLQGGVRRCDVSPQHWIPRAMEQCVWCEFRTMGIDYFPDTEHGIRDAAPESTGAHADLDDAALRALWDAIAAVPKRAGFDEALRRQHVVPPLPPIVPTKGLFGSVLTSVWAFVGNEAARRTLELEAQARQALEVHHAEMSTRADQARRLQARLQEAHEKAWGAAMAELSLVHLQVDNGLRWREGQLRSIKERIRSDQRDDHLRRNWVRDSQITGIGTGLIATLSSYGIETAYDVLKASPAVSASAQRAAAPSCPTCRRGMVKRRAKRGRFSGSEFWGCPGYPSCRGTRPFSAPGASHSAGGGLADIPGIGATRCSDLVSWAKRVDAACRPNIQVGDVAKEKVRLSVLHRQRTDELVAQLRSGPGRLHALNRDLQHRCAAEMAQLAELRP